ncbi:MAG: hypothetical protein RL514_2674 [Verrucomicrobiota bacterium]|jgi:hypothetical protein
MTTNHDDAARRAYWAEQMELGYELVQRTLTFEVSECGEGSASVHIAAFTTAASSSLSLVPQAVHNAPAMQLHRSPSP